MKTIIALTSAALALALCGAASRSGSGSRRGAREDETLPMRPPRSGAGAGGFLHIRTVRRDSSMTRLSSRLAAAFGVALALGLLVSDPADARRGGSFGSRGA